MAEKLFIEAVRSAMAALESKEYRRAVFAVESTRASFNLDIDCSEEVQLAFAQLGEVACEALSMAGNHDEAIAEGRNGTVNFPTRWEGYVQTARAYQRAGRYDEAREWAAKAFRIAGPRNAVVHVAMVGIETDIKIARTNEMLGGAAPTRAAGRAPTLGAVEPLQRGAAKSTGPSTPNVSVSGGVRRDVGFPAASDVSVPRAASSSPSHTVPHLSFGALSNVGSPATAVTPLPRTPRFTAGGGSGATGLAPTGQLLSSSNTTCFAEPSPEDVSSASMRTSTAADHSFSPPLAPLTIKQTAKTHTAPASSSPSSAASPSLSSPDLPPFVAALFPRCLKTDADGLLAAAVANGLCAVFAALSAVALLSALYRALEADVVNATTSSAVSSGSFPISSGSDAPRPIPSGLVARVAAALVDSLRIPIDVYAAVFLYTAVAFAARRAAAAVRLLLAMTAERREEAAARARAAEAAEVERLRAAEAEAEAARSRVQRSIGSGKVSIRLPTLPGGSPRGGAQSPAR